RLVLTKDHFTINVPAYHWPFSDPAIHQTRDNASPALEIKGKCDVNFTDAKNFDVKFFPDYMLPTSFTMGTQGTFIDNGDPYYGLTDWELRTDGEPTRTELKVTNGRWPSFIIYVPVKQTRRSKWRTLPPTTEVLEKALFSIISAHPE
ncbi:MAG: hypothetical protein K6G08_05385, partial [Prevotella sp.]|nr:hypothetical protein [Prevotella sp.]